MKKPKKCDSCNQEWPDLVAYSNHNCDKVFRVSKEEYKLLEIENRELKERVSWLESLTSTEDLLSE